MVNIFTFYMDILEIIRVKKISNSGKAGHDDVTVETVTTKKAEVLGE